MPHFSNGGRRLPEPADANQRRNPSGGLVGCGADNDPTPHSREGDPALTKKAKHGNVVEGCLRLSLRFLLPNREREACSGYLTSSWHPCPLEKRGRRLVEANAERRRTCGACCSLWQ